MSDESEAVGGVAPDGLEGTRASASPTRRPNVAVLGAGAAGPSEARMARRLGRLLAEGGAVVVTGGRGGIMEAASRGAAEAGGETIGILPGSDARESPPNPFVRFAVFTGLGDARNAVVVRSSTAVVAIGGGYGTLSEIGLALKAGRPVVLLRSWRLRPPGPIEGIERLLRQSETPEDAARLALQLAIAWRPEGFAAPNDPPRPADRTGPADEG